MAGLLASGQTSLNWLPVWLTEYLLYFTLPLAAVTALMLVVTGAFRVFGGPLNWKYVTSAAFGLSVLAGCVFMAYSAIYDQWYAVIVHGLGAAFGVLVAGLGRSKLTPSGTDPFDN